MLSKGITHQFIYKEHENINLQSTSKETSTSMNPKENTTLPVLTTTPSSVTVPSSIATLAVPPSTKNIEMVIKKNIKPSNIKKSYVQISNINILPNIEDVL